MKKPEYDLFDLELGKFEDFDVDPEEYFDNVIKEALKKESDRLFQVYKAEREIVQSILDNIHDTDVRSTD
jgi:hypothetical protein